MRHVNIVLICLALLAFGLPTLALAEPPQPVTAPPPEPEPAPAPAVQPREEPSEDGYARWLERYGAWDRLDQAYVEQEETPEIVIKRAEVHIQLGAPGEALALLQRSGPFEDNSTEANRLWLGAQAQRALGDPARSVSWYAQAAKYLEERDARSRFRNEPGLDIIWKDVWRKLFWSWSSNPSSSRQAQTEFLQETLEIAQTVWSDSYWRQVGSVFDALTAPLPPAPEAEQAEATTQFIGPESRKLLARALASVALEDFEGANATLSGVEPAVVRTFWTDLSRLVIQEQEPESISSYASSGYGKAAAFWTADLLGGLPHGRNQWLLGNPDSDAWVRFRDNLLSMPPARALAAIDKEMGSLLITEETSLLLQAFKLSFALIEGNDTMAKTIWYALDHRGLPLSLQLAGMILFNGQLADMMPPNTAEATALYPVLATLSSAAGVDPRTPQNAPFWSRISGSSLERAINGDWPLDRLLVLAAWEGVFDNRPQATIARRAAYLVPRSDLGIRSILFLARDASNNRQFELASQYLSMLDVSRMTVEENAERLEIIAEMEMGAGRQDQALATYQQLVRTGAEVPVMTRLQMALLLQQTGDLQGGREHLLILWEDRENLDKPMQAEILYWLGEGEQAMGNMDQALDYYLRLAYEYPEQNIWAITAMYRASMIYEMRGQFDTAKRLLNTVISRADTQEQREAARARLNAIEGRMGRPAPDGVVYPF